MVRSYAKINLSIDVGERQPDGFHPVDMIMQQIQFHDDVTVVYQPSSRRERGDITVSLQSNRVYLPSDERNLAVKAAILMIREYGKDQPGGRIDIRLLKRIPVAAGMAGGSGNGAAVIHGLNALWELGLSLGRIMELCGELGSDVPFCAMGQANANRVLPDNVRFDRMSSCAARATGSGTILEPFRGDSRPVVIAKPRISVSTAEVYQGFDRCVPGKRPDNDRLLRRILSGDPAVYEDYINVLEWYTLAHYPVVGQLKERMSQSGAEVVLMSGSGPTVFAVYGTSREAEQTGLALRKEGWEAYWTKTMS